MQTGPVIAITKGITKEVIKTSNELMHSAPIASSRFPTHLTNLEFTDYFASQTADAYAARTQPVASSSSARQDIEMDEKERKSE